MPTPALARRSPWPEPTREPTPDSSTSRKRKRRQSSHPPRSIPRNEVRRQTIADEPDVENAETQCQVFSGNYIESCWPTANTSVAQHEWVTFVWNSNLPQFKQTNLVDIYLCDADTSKPVISYHNVTNPTGQAGWIRAEVNDTLWGEKGAAWNGQNISYPFYFIITQAGHALDGSQEPQPTWDAVQTTYADFVVASISSSAAVASASAASVLSSLSAAHRANPTSASASIQSGSNDGSFPHWAIAVIVILGFLAIVATCILIFLVLRRLRRKREAAYNRDSMHSASPMMAESNVGHSTTSPLLGAAAAAGLAGVTAGNRDTMNQSLHDGASTLSRANSADAGPFSGADAAIMADAFRKALRKPDFNQAVEEGDTPDSKESQGQKQELINRELAEEGRHISSVGSSRGVTVQTLTDDAGDNLSTTEHGIQG